MKTHLLTIFVCLLAFCNYAQVDFEEKTVIDNQNATNNARSVFAADIDGDGDMDILSASSDDDKIAWYENTNGQGAYGNQQLISTEANGAQSVFAIDIDGDSDMDVLSASSFDNKIAWYENLDGQGTFSSQQIITTNAFNAQSVFAADIDGDGNMDVLSASGPYGEGKIAWHQNIDGLGNFGTQQIITTEINLAQSVFAADIDGDGDIDVLANSLVNQNLAWYENTNGQGDFVAQQIVSSTSTSSISAADIDNDGNIDVVSAGGDQVAWFKNLDGEGSFGPQQVILTTSSSAYDAITSDIDGDGDLDVVSGFFSDDTTPAIVWNENLDGAGNFGTMQEINNTAQYAISLYLNDINNDGNIDVLFASQDRIGYNKNVDGNGTFETQQNITYNVEAPTSVYAADINGDGNMDILSASEIDGEIAWYENLEGYGNFSLQKSISQKMFGTRTVVASDIDGDNDMDVLATVNTKIEWYENLDGNGNFSLHKNIITDQYASFVDASIADIDRDGDKDVVSASFFSGKLSWFENMDGQGNFGPEYIIADDSGFAPISIDIVDLNNDGALDIVSAALNDGEVNWHENLNGEGDFGPPQLITSSYNNNVDFVQGSDLDGDNDVDIIITNRSDGKIVWFENTNSQGSFSQEKIITTEVDTPLATYSVDLDNDGDLDVISASADDNKVAWYENMDGLGNFSSQNIISNNADGANSIYAADIDSDGDVDVISSLALDNQINWYKNSLILKLNETPTLDFSIHPNPSSDYLNITLQKEITQIAVYNNVGQLVMEPVDFTNDNPTINTATLATGIYFIKIKTEDGKVGIRKFIKI
ncbi:T9SS type A sorting domain-containing protein [Marixanthomonas ophiurae]|uniref:T9SS C-terminal target domain-containing protein n=1 Tax=Marixanthomonas ophiurae TaxID=387659 RepID=A0A3E1Q9Q6_9FLAO|nr:T9SS type A sorting domain-containing protein [Marixanthomonas ophiurae]RFN58861.1 T9SS C-terminal target domain-containing protein [Marixanthomonas ophiurae]